MIQNEKTTKQLKNGVITKDEADIKSACKHDYVLRGGPAVYFHRCTKCGKIKM